MLLVSYSFKGTPQCHFSLPTHAVIKEKNWRHGQ